MTTSSLHKELAQAQVICEPGGSRLRSHQGHIGLRDFAFQLPTIAHFTARAALAGKLQPKPCTRTGFKVPLAKHASWMQTLKAGQVCRCRQHHRAWHHVDPCTTPSNRTETSPKACTPQESCPEPRQALPHPHGHHGWHLAYDRPNESSEAIRCRPRNGSGSCGCVEARDLS